MLSIQFNIDWEEFGGLWWFPGKKKIFAMAFLGDKYAKIFPIIIWILVWNDMSVPSTLLIHFCWFFFVFISCQDHSAGTRPNK